MRRQRATETVIAARDLHRLILDVIVWLADTFLVLKVLVGHATSATLVVISGLRSLEIFESVASLRADRSTVLLVAFGCRGVNHEVILVLLVHGGLALVGY